MTGCYHVPYGGYLTVNHSEFDGTEEISTHPSFVCKGNILLCNMTMRLHRRSVMPADQAVLTVEVRGIENFAEGTPLHFNIDGEFIDLVPIRGITEFRTDRNPVAFDQTITWSGQQFLVSKDLIKKLVTGGRVMIKVNLSNSYLEAPFSNDEKWKARRAFLEFYKVAFQTEI